MRLFNRDPRQSRQERRARRAAGQEAARLALVEAFTVPAPQPSPEDRVALNELYKKVKKASLEDR